MTNKIKIQKTVKKLLELVENEIDSGDFHEAAIKLEDGSTAATISLADIVDITITHFPISGKIEILIEVD